MDTPQPHHITLGGKLYRLCPTLDDLSAIEKKLSTSILALGKKLAGGLISLEELIVILEHSIESEAHHLRLKELALAAGITHVTQSITALFLHLFRGSDHHDIPAAGITKDELGDMAKKFPDNQHVPPPQAGEENPLPLTKS